VRLGTCIALELAMAAGAVAAVGFGVGHAVTLAGDYVGAREAQAATSVRPRASQDLARAIAPLPRAELSATPPPIFTDTVFGASDATLLDPIGATPLVRIKPNKGGVSLSLRADYASGARALLKPFQVQPQNPFAEVAAFRIDRLLGIGHVAPAKPFVIDYQTLLDAADPAWKGYTQHRILEEVKARDGMVRGMVAWWIPEIRDARIDNVPVDIPEGMGKWIPYLRIGAQIPADVRGLVEQIATMIVFDVVIDNSDRWSGANVKASPDGKTLYFMDNTLAFSKFKHGHDSNLKPLERMQVFPRGLVERLRTLTLEQVQQALALDGELASIGPLLGDEEVRAIISRRNHVLERVDALIAEFGEDQVLALP
jgi:hypothetical protein